VNDEFVADEILNFIHNQITLKQKGVRQKPILTKKMIKDHFNFYLNLLNIQTVEEKEQKD